MIDHWTCDSWRTKPIKQHPLYPEPEKLTVDRKAAHDVSSFGFCW